MPRNEHQTRVELINPALYDRGWTDALIREEKTPGGTDIIDGKPVRRRGRTDYLLCLPVEGKLSVLRVAVLEAKSEDKLPSLGIQQARDYMRKFNVPFAFSTNGHLYVEYGEDTGRIKDPMRLSEFPAPHDLRHRYEGLKGLTLDADSMKPLFIPYKGGEAARWYFQDAAIRATLERIAGGQRRILLSLATGTGKTIIAAQLLWKITQAGQLKRALFVCDRDELRTQGYQKLHNIFGDNAQVVTTDDPQRNAKVLVATYQTLNITEEDAEPRFWKDTYPPNFFSHIIIDECHRSAWGKWSVVLTDNPDAVQVGLTATPRIIIGGKTAPGRGQDEAITAHNVEYFGQPVYEYTMGEGREDGYVAACEIIRRVVDLDKKEITKEDIRQRTAIDPFTGRKVQPNEIEERYTAKEYEVKLMLDDRVKAMCEDFFDHLLSTGSPHQKTIIFCARESHAQQVAIQMNNIYGEWCRANQRVKKEDYAFECTGDPDLRPSADKLIPDFKGSKNSHFIATTVDLLGYGVDVPNLENVVFFRYIESPISFYQMVGRGTRTGEPRGSKPMFRLYDYTNATRLFGEPFESRATPAVAEEVLEEVQSPEHDYGVQRPRQRIIRVPEQQFTVVVEGEGRSILCSEEGKDVLVPIEEYKRRLAERLVEEAPDIESLRWIWINPEHRQGLLNILPGGKAAVYLIRELEEQQECDLFDVLVQLGYGVPAKSRSERVGAFSYKNKNWLRQFPDRTSDVLLAITRQFEKGGIEELETPNLFDVKEIQDTGGFDALKPANLEPQVLIQETKARLLA
jgi:type I restriction enzyme R subunit